MHSILGGGVLQGANVRFLARSIRNAGAPGATTKDNFFGAASAVPPTKPETQRERIQTKRPIYRRVLGVWRCSPDGKRNKTRLLLTEINNRTAILPPYFKMSKKTSHLDTRVGFGIYQNDKTTQQEKAMTLFPLVCLILVSVLFLGLLAMIRPTPSTNQTTPAPPHIPSTFASPSSILFFFSGLLWLMWALLLVIWSLATKLSSVHWFLTCLLFGGTILSWRLFHQHMDTISRPKDPPR